MIRAARLSFEERRNWWQTRYCPAFQFYLWLQILALLGGCAAGGGTGDVRTDAFSEFTTSIQELRTGTDEILAGLVKQSEARFRANLVEDIQSGDELPGTVLALADVQFTTTGSAFTIVDAPYFLRVPAFKLAQYQTISALVEYADLLETLAKREMNGADDDVSSLSATLNSNVQSAATGINSDIKPEEAGKLAVLSSVAGDLMENYLKGKHKENLVAAIDHNHATIVALTEHLQEGTRVLNLALQNEFNQERDRYSAIFEDASAGNDARIVAGLKLVDLVKQRYLQQETLLKLYESYGQLPAAHRALSKFEREDSSGISRIISLAETAKSLRATYDATVLQTRQQHIQAEIDRAEALATAAEVEASKASVAVSVTTLELEQKRVVLASTPDDEVLGAQVDELEASLATLKTDQEQKLTNAQALRAAANAVSEASRGLLELID